MPKVCSHKLLDQPQQLQQQITHKIYNTALVSGWKYPEPCVTHNARDSVVMAGSTYLLNVFFPVYALITLASYPGLDCVDKPDTHTQNQKKDMSSIATEMDFLGQHTHLICSFTPPIKGHQSHNEVLYHTNLHIYKIRSLNVF